MKNGLIISLVLLTLFSCENKFPNYIKKETDVYMKLLSFEESDKAVRQKGFGAIGIEIYDNDKLLYKHYKEERINIENNKFDFLIQYMNLGDSCGFMVPKERITNTFRPLKLKETNADYLSVYIKFNDYFLDEGDKEMVEQFILKKYLSDMEYEFNEGVYIKINKVGTGDEIKKGDEITIAYKGSFINGLEFDNISGKLAFTFSYGAQGQVIKGLDLSIKTMRDGQKSKIIIPSQLAFGEVGSTTLIVPSYTTVVYDLEIIKVNRITKINNRLR